MSHESAYESVDAEFRKAHLSGRSPGLVYGVVLDGELIHSGAFGTTALDEERPPTVTTVQRIASMTKSFTASAVLLLVERGQLALDAPVASYVPEFQPMHSADSAPVTIRHLLTMSAGLLTDDPWGDRNESQTPEELDAFLAGGFLTGARPGEAFEYANLGYAVMGRVIDRVLGADGGFRAFVLDELVTPLGMPATTYDVSLVGSELAVGFQPRSSGWVAEPSTSPGTFSAMGGLHSSATDLARWVGGFTDAFRNPSAPHPLSPASRRDMQQAHRFIDVEAKEGKAAAAYGYGFGLIAEHHADHGHVAQHSGGYPGYGSHMRWHPETGLGVIALANGTYAAPVAAATEALRALVLAADRPRALPVPTTQQLVEEVTRRVAATIADHAPFNDHTVFTANVAMDVPEEERQVQLAKLREEVGLMRLAVEELTPRADGLGHIAWSIPAANGRYELEIKIAPTLEPRVQQVVVKATVPGDSAEVAAAVTPELDEG
ncbi:serine hydrolase domain-containing protein [Nocardioides sp. Kera G14]|uniref:serine hydrolase domain-containing protein n=1 Tax=Nocardioides sp. Kera G14 TaxID=2884264 RepID=UPI001D0F6A80|nr:serine hydrolase domain-containing protein [Nocardioides sp. Kera G14]UDY24826.1 beta-lactamase family protein [Nocardioides sp. Kera G14]